MKAPNTFPTSPAALLPGLVALGLMSAAHAELVGLLGLEDGEELTDFAGNFPDLSLVGNATVSDGALDVNGSGTNATGWAYTTGGAGYAGPAIGDKTLVSWVTVQSPSTTASAGSAMTIDRVNSDQFDGIIFAEAVANRWMNGSNNFFRTSNFPGGDNTQFNSGTETELGTGVIVQLAITYETMGAENQITGYREGVQMGQYNVQAASSQTFATWPAGDAEVIFGKRHGNPATAGPGALDALIHEARIYNNVLSEAEIQALTLTSIVDSDDDGLDDAWEQAVIDSDPDDAIETLADVNPGDDLDGDTLTNLMEFREWRTDPLNPDTDGDNLRDDVETNTRMFVDASDTGTNPNDPDTDGDGLQDDVETGTKNFVSATNTGTDPNKADSDGDGLSDGDEIADPFTDPNDQDDPPPPPLEQTLIGQWTFEAGVELVDQTGNWPNLVLKGDAAVADGQLDLNGAGTTATGWAHTGAGDFAGTTDIAEKTLVSWLTIQSPSSVAGAGSAITLDTKSGDVFDGIIFGEQSANRWMNGSNGFQRTMDFGASADEPSTDGTEEVMLAITYEDLGGGNVRITGYRDGVQVGQYDDTPFATWSPSNVEIIFGKRHGDPNSGAPGALDALIQESRLYASAATPAQILELFNAGPGGGEALRFTNVMYDPGAGAVTVEWVSKIGATYTVEFSSDLSFWIEEDDSVPTGGATSDRTSYTFEGIPPGTPARYFRVSEQ